MPATRKPIGTDREIGALIRRHRVAKGLTLKSLAREIGCTYQQVQKYEAGSNRVAASILLQIADTLNVSVAALYPTNER
jgi:transcriptional regulator with XRE-family HTH domain